MIFERNSMSGEVVPGFEISFSVLGEFVVFVCGRVTFLVGYDEDDVLLLFVGFWRFCCDRLCEKYG